MMPSTKSGEQFVAVTGATGAIGHCALAQLLRAGDRCVALVRDPERDAARLRRLLAAFDLDAEALLSAERLVLVRAELPRVIDSVGLRIGSVLHAAGCTRFATDSAGDPRRTNVEGLAATLEWAARQGARSFHLVSTAYVCGKHDGVVAEGPLADRPAFHNAYEESKWLGEALARAWAGEDPDRTLTTLRPSIVVGDSTTGRTTSFSGFYLSVRALELVAQRARVREEDGDTVLRTPGRADGRQNVVPVDYVATVAAGIVRTRAFHGGVYHLVNPDPPTNAMIRDAIQRCVGFEGLRFDDGANTGARSVLERLFDRLVEPIRAYFVDTPRFDRTNAARAEAALGVAAPRVGGADLERLVRWAIDSGWTGEHGAIVMNPEAADGRARSAAEYFESFLPDRVARSQVARMHGVSATVRFVITDVENGEWTCRFERGLLARTHRGSDGLHEEFGYRLDAESFLRAVGGGVEPQAVFLDGRVQIFGDVERALKMAMVLHLFNREHPFQPGAQTGAGVPR